MGSVRRRPDADGRPGQWIARWREPDGTQRKKSFARKTDAERYLVQVEGRMQTGDYTPPAAAKITVEDWSRTWLAAQAHLKPSTRARYEGLLRTHVLPAFGRRSLEQVRHADVVAWVASLTGKGLAPGTVRQAHRVLALLLALAVKDGRLTRNAAEGAALPRARRAEPRFLRPDEIAALLTAIPRQEDRLVVVTLAYTGLRFGELSALRVEDVDLMRRRLRVHRSGTEIGGHYVEGAPKTHQARTVAIPTFVTDQLIGHLAGRGRGDRAFPAPEGGPLRINNWSKRVFGPACQAAGLVDLSPHDLRHTAASLAVAAGANVKAVQRMLGHASAAMTLDVYAGLFADELDAVAVRLDALAPQVRPAPRALRVVE